MTEKGCDNCYYSFFDERAYPCSLCIRGIERTDQWQPSKKTKADRKTENKSEKPNKSTISKMEQVDGECADCKWHDKEWWYIKCDGCSRLHSHFEPKDEPQTERSE